MGPPGAQWSACTKTRCSKVAFVVKSKWSRFWETRWSVQFADVAAGAAIARDVENFLKDARVNGVCERFASTKHQLTKMFQFRDADLPQSLLDREQRSSDGSTRLGRHGAPPACVGRLLAGVHEALPELARHYRVGWVQINDSSGADEIRGHVDRPGWGDVICTFTTARCALTLKPDAQVRGRAPKCAATFEVPANSLYVLSGASRAFVLALHGQRTAIARPCQQGGSSSVRNIER